jgi:serine/threonine-protein kinase
VADVPGLVEEFGWTVEVIEVRETGAAHGTVLRQDPAPGEELEEGPDSVLKITTSVSNALAAPPTGLEGLPRADAEAAITGAGFAVGTVEEAPNEDVAAGTVVSVGYAQELIDGQLPEGDPVNLVVSTGPLPRTVPGVDGRGYDAIAAALEADGLVPARAEESSQSVPEGQVIRLQPGSGELVERGSTVTIVVSTGLPLVTIPDVIGMDEDEAIATLEGAGLVIGDRIGRPNRPVLATDPPAGESVRQGTEVTIITRST